MNNVPLDEGAGEGYHRRTNLTKARSAGAKTEWILGSTRVEQNHDLCRNFLNGSVLSETVLRFEWKHYKRILRPSARKEWTPVRMTNKRFFRKLYNVEKNPDDWEPFVNPKAPRSAGGDDGVDPKPGQNEYIRSVFKKEEVYSVPVSRYENIDGDLQEVEDTHFFQVLEVWQGSHRLKTVDTVFKTEADEAGRAPVALTTQSLEVWQKRSEEEFTVFLDASPEVANVTNVASWETIRKTMKMWKVELSDTVGCLDLSHPRQAKPPYALTDANCPTLMIFDKLRSDGWAPVNATITHVDVALRFDGRDPGPGRKFYYQALMVLAEVLLVSGSLDSQQPMSYYQLALRGIRVVAGLGDKAYRKALAEADGDRDALLALEGAPEVGVLRDREFDGAGDSDAIVPVAAPARVRGARRPAGKARAKVAPPALPAPPLDEKPSDSSDSSSDQSGISSLRWFCSPSAPPPQALSPPGPIRPAHLIPVPSARGMNG